MSTAGSTRANLRTYALKDAHLGSLFVCFVFPIRVVYMERNDRHSNRSQAIIISQNM